MSSFRSFLGETPAGLRFPAPEEMRRAFLGTWAVDPAPLAPEVTHTERYEDFLAAYFPGVACVDLAQRHRDLWVWFETITLSTSPPPALKIWPRGGAKSSSAEMGVVYTAMRKTRRFCLYVSGTQEQADGHVQNIASLFESVGVERRVGKYGTSKGWRRNQLRTADGFNVAALGLDTASRGVKFEDVRPDLMIFDDIDDQEDTAKTIRRKERAITQKIMPARGPSCAVLMIQNRIREDGVVSRVADGRADFLASVDVHEEPAVLGLKTVLDRLPNGRSYHRIVAGTPTWQGQDLEVCQRNMIEWGYSAFCVEAQHEVDAGAGLFFNVALLIEKPFNPALLKRVVRFWDQAGSEGAGDYSAGVLMGLLPNGVVVVLDVVRAQVEESNLRRLMQLTQAWDRSRYGGKYAMHIAQDPGSAGKALATIQARDLGIAKPSGAVSGRKAIRARPLAKAVNDGNCWLGPEGPRSIELDAFLDQVSRRTDLEGRHREWQTFFRRELKEFREDETHLHDDQVDAAADAFVKLSAGAGGQVGLLPPSRESVYSALSDLNV